MLHKASSGVCRIKPPKSILLDTLGMIRYLDIKKIPTSEDFYIVELLSTKKYFLPYKFVRKDKEANSFNFASMIHIDVYDSQVSEGFDIEGAAGCDDDAGFNIEGAGSEDRSVSIEAARTVSHELIHTWFLFASGMSLSTHTVGSHKYYFSFCWNGMLLLCIVCQAIFTLLIFFVLLLESFGVNTYLNYFETSANVPATIFILAQNLNTVGQCVVLFFLFDSCMKRVVEPLSESSARHCHKACQDAVTYSRICLIPVILYFICAISYRMNFFNILFAFVLICQIFVLQLAYFFVSMDSFYCLEQINALIDSVKAGTLMFDAYLDIKDAVHSVKRRSLWIREGIIANAYIATMLIAIAFYLEEIDRFRINGESAPFVVLLYYLAAFSREPLLLYFCMPQISAINDASARLSEALIHSGTVKTRNDFLEQDAMKEERALIWASNNDFPVGHSVFGQYVRSKLLRRQVAGFLCVLLVGVLRFSLTKTVSN